VLAEVAGRPFLAHLLDQLAWTGFAKVILCTGYAGDRVEDALGSDHNGLQLVYSREETPLGTAGCLRLAAPLFDTDTVLVLNGDSFCGLDLTNFASWHAVRHANAALVLAHVEDTSRFGKVDVDADERVLRFLEKQEPAGPGWINAGIYLVSATLLRDLPGDRVLSLERDVFPKWIGRGFYAYRTGARFIDIGTAESYRSSEQFFAVGSGSVRAENQAALCEADHP
jgi:NDP-sugar pyrophosphorylase family protein